MVSLMLAPHVVTILKIDSPTAVFGSCLAVSVWLQVQCMCRFEDKLISPFWNIPSLVDIEMVMRFFRA